MELQQVAPSAAREETPERVELPRPERISRPLRMASSSESGDLINASAIGGTTYRFIAPRTGRRVR